MLFSWANKQLEKLSETMAPMSNSATGQFTQALQQNDINTAMGLLRSGGGGGGGNGSVSAPSSMSHQYSYSNGAPGGSGPTEAETFIDPHHTIFHNQKQNKALHMIAQYSNMTLFSYVINTFYTNMGMDMMEVLNLRDANGDTILHYAAMSTTPKAFSFVQSLVNNYKEQIVKSLNVKNHYNQTPYDVSANDKIRQFLLPLQLQYETQECLKNGGVGLPKGIDLGGLKIENSNMAPPPIMSSGSGLGGPGVGPSAGGPPMNGNGGGNMYSMGNSGVTKVRYAIPTELANATSPSTTPTASLSPMNYQYNQSQFSPSATATISPTATATATHATMMMMQPNAQQPTSDTAATATVADTSATSDTAVTAAATTISPSPTASLPATATLPSGWIELMDQTSNTPYYYNQETNVTQWERPISPVAQTDTNTNTSVADNTSAAVTDTIDTNSNVADSCTETDNNKNTTTEAVVVDDTNVETKEDIIQEKKEEKQNDELKEEEQTEAEKMDEKDESIPITKDEKKEEELNKENSNIVDKASNVATVSSVTDTSDINNNKIETETASVLGETKEESPGLQKTEISTEAEKETTQDTNLIAGKEQLPEGWTELYDETSRNSYYYHQGNNVTQWDKPTAAAVATMANGNSTNSSSSLPSGWVELVDPSSGAAYYYNQQQNLTQWEKPIDTASASIATTPATTMMNPARNATWKTQKPSTSAPSSAPSNSKYAKRGFSTAAVLPSNSKYKPDGFHSSSSDKTLQQKYGHDASITAPPSGRHFSGATSIAPPPSSSGSNVNMSKGYNPYAGSAGVGGYGTNYPSAGYNNNNAYGYNSGNASAGASQYNAYNPSTNYNQHSGMTTGSDYQYQMNTTNDYQSQLAAGGYNNQQQQNPHSYPTANQQQQPQPHQQYPTADASFQSTPNVLGNGEVPPSSDINDQTVSKPDANDKTVDTSITNEEKKSMDDQHQTSFSPDTQLPDATPKIATEAFDSNFAAKEETVVVADSVPAKEEQITPTVESSENTPSEVQINDKNTDTVETNNTFAQSDSAAAFFGVGVEEASLPIENEDDILPPPPIINDAIETSEITDMAIDQSNDIILSPPPTITDEVDNKPVTDSTIGDLMPPPILSIPDEKDDEKKNDEIGSIEKSDDLMPPPTFLGQTVDDADSDQLLPPPPMMDIAL